MKARPTRDRSDGDPVDLPRAAATVAASLYPLQTLALALGTAGPRLDLALSMASGLVWVRPFVGALLGGLAGYLARDDRDRLGRRFGLRVPIVGTVRYGAGAGLALLVGAVAATLVPGGEFATGASDVGRTLGYVGLPALTFVSATLAGGLLGAMTDPATGSEGATPDEGPPGADDRVDPATADALRRLRTRYVEGAVDEAELERRTAAILAADARDPLDGGAPGEQAGEHAVGGEHTVGGEDPERRRGPAEGRTDGSTDDRGECTADDRALERE